MKPLMCELVVMTAVSDFSWTTANQTNAFYIASSITLPCLFAEVVESLKAWSFFLVNQFLEIWCWGWEAELAWRGAHRKWAWMGTQGLLWSVRLLVEAGEREGRVDWAPLARLKPSASTPAGVLAMTCGALLSQAPVWSPGRQRPHPPTQEGSWQQPPMGRSVLGASLPKRCASLAGIVLGYDLTVEIQKTWTFLAGSESDSCQAPEIQGE